MSQMPWYCPGCAGEQLFEQFHDDPGRCPDSPDGHCPEWACCACGTALIVGFLPGTAPDVAARLIGQRLSDQLGRPVIVENHAGASSDTPRHTAS